MVISVKLRESIPVGKVKVIIDDRVVFQSSEYSTAVNYLQNRFLPTEIDIHSIYCDYKDNYDAIPSIVNETQIDKHGCFIYEPNE